MIPIGTVYHKLTVIADATPCHHGYKRVMARCRCGAERVFRVCNLISGNTRSCGGRNCRKNSISNTYWVPERCAELVLRASEEGVTYGQIAQLMGKSTFAIVAQMKKMGLKAKMTPQYVRVAFDKMPDVKFEDISRPDRDRHLGFKPMPGSNRQSLVGCSAAECAR